VWFDGQFYRNGDGEPDGGPSDTLVLQGETLTLIHCDCKDVDVSN